MIYVPSILCLAFALSVFGFWVSWIGKRSASMNANNVMLIAAGVALGLGFHWLP